MRLDTINAENVERFACIAEPKTKIKGIVLFFHGIYEMGGKGITPPEVEAKAYGDNGLLYVIPFCGPMSWMNKGVVRIVDDVVDALIEKYNLSPSVPVVSSGMSMGGLGAITFARVSRHRQNICCVASNCPVCDLILFRDHRDDIPRSTFNAFAGYDMPIDDAIRTVSPIEHVSDSPDIPYFIVHCEGDSDVPKAEHSDRLVPRLRDAGYDVTYVSVPERGHCDMGADVRDQFNRFIIDHCK